MVQTGDGAITEPVPTYTEKDTSPFLAQFEYLQASFPNNPYKFPITTYPAPLNRKRGVNNSENRQAVQLEQARALIVDIIDQYFGHITHKRDDAVETFISHGLVGPMTPSPHGETPLLRAVRTGNLAMVRRLIQLGADVNEFGRLPIGYHYDSTGPQLLQSQRPQWTSGSQDLPLSGGPRRTPLMLAASNGNFAIVRCLVSDFGANDTLVSPDDGAIALRCAARAGHREIVAFLPTCRRGAWLRWKTAHSRYILTAKLAGKAALSFIAFFVISVPKFLLLDCPYYGVRAIWSCRHWAKRQMLATPERAIHAMYAIFRGAKKVREAVSKMPRLMATTVQATVQVAVKTVHALPGFLRVAWRLIIWIAKMAPKAANLILRAVWHVIKAIPGAVVVVTLWFRKGANKVGGAVVNAAARAVSLFHMTISALLTWFSGVTLVDIWNGFVDLLHAIFISVPRALWHFLLMFGDVSRNSLKKLFGSLGVIFWYIGYYIILSMGYIPDKILKIGVAIARSVRKGFEEIFIWFDPKRISSQQ